VCGAELRPRDFIPNPTTNDDRQQRGEQHRKNRTKLTTFQTRIYEPFEMLGKAAGGGVLIAVGIVLVALPLLGALDAIAPEPGEEDDFRWVVAIIGGALIIGGCAMFYDAAQSFVRIAYRRIRGQGP